ncbi:flagellar brake protein [Methylotenera versatilis]|uniref:Flagellar brake protein YcgR n=1 Tax=Methylotenera versatilis (strain 301) TaxID=666681 RepID=D7DQ28_METV0|nr:flagellar brake protein [Methylotenera versatilis]ADI29399.1 type IV pilus assembly PilZ [Methylotenera versatilis 301]
MEDAAHANDEEQFIVQNQKQIIQILNELAKHHELLKISFSHDTCLTNVISVDAHNHVVYLDIGIDDAFNDRLLASHHVVFAKEDGVRIKWTSAQLTLATLKDGKAIKIALPQKLMRLQRREFFRLATPIVNPVPCIIPIPNAENPDEDGTLELTLVDVSLGGVGVIAANPLDEVLVIGANFDKCRINFPEVGETNLTLQVRNITPVTMKDGATKYRVGLQFISPSRGNEGLINKYTFNLERQVMALASKM